MAWLIDGSNVIGAMGLDRDAVDPKRELARLAASFARAKKTRLTLYFDGPEPAGFARHLGSVTIVFSGKRSADDAIAEQASGMRDAHVVTSDRELAARISGRRVEVIDTRRFLREMEAAAESPASTAEEDWLRYFSDPQNREKF